jgi:hypothetical protein
MKKLGQQKGDDKREVQPQVLQIPLGRSDTVQEQPL